MQGRASERTGRSRLNSHEAHERTVAPCRLHCWSLQFHYCKETISIIRCGHIQ